MSLIEVKDLKVKFKITGGHVYAVNGISFKADKGECVGVVGESGSGKSQTFMAIKNILDSNASKSGSVLFKGQEILHTKSANPLLKKIGFIFQDPMTSLNPYLKISTQLIETIRLTKQNISREEIIKKAIDMLDLVKIPSAKSRFNSYPYEFSGGMRQRVMIAMTLLAKPEILIADEPTTALDVTVQADIIDIFNNLNKEFNMLTFFITHDLSLIKNICDSVLVMYAGKIMELGERKQVFSDPKHPYTKALLKSVLHFDLHKDKKIPTISGNPPNMTIKQKGCPFAIRCEQVVNQCNVKKIDMNTDYNKRSFACINERGNKN